MRERFFAAARRVRGLLGPRAVILMYHRIADESSDPYGLCVRPDHFEEHLRAIRDVCRPTRVADVLASLRNGAGPARTVCLTFDDGYLDNLRTAAPLLEKHDTPALVFVVTGEDGRGREFWWDELERILLGAEELPARLELEVGGRRHGWDLGADHRYDRERREEHRAWRLYDEPWPTARHAVLRQVYDVIQPLAVEERTRALDTLFAWAGLDRAAVRPERRAMQPEQVAALVERRIMDVGAHTVNHPALPAHAAHVQRAEIERSRRDLEAWTGGRVRGFAYPYGQHDDAAVDAVRGAGFEFACSGEYRAATRRSDPFLLPRIEAPAGDGDALGRILHRHLA